jgi:hypothetical protein
MLDASIIINGILAAAALVSAFIGLRVNAAMQTVKLDMANSNAQMTARFEEKFESLRKEITLQFVPGPLDQERRNNILNRLEFAEAEIQRNRERNHDLASTITNVALQQTALVGQVANIEQRLQVFVDQSRANHERLARVEQSVEKRHG